MATDQRRDLRSDGAIPYSKDKILNDLILAYSNRSDESVLAYDQIDPQAADTVLELAEEHLERRSPRITYNSLHKELKFVFMPSEIHDAHQQRIIKSITKLVYDKRLNFDDYMTLNISVGTMCGSFIGNYALSKKQPDLAIQPDDQRLPAVVIESGWSESRHSLEKDRDLWLHGGVGIVQIVIIVEWTKIDGLWVKSDIQVFDLDERGELRLLQEEVIFPAPDPEIAAEQNISISKRQLLGTTLSPGVDGNGLFYLDLELYRAIAAPPRSCYLGRVPAEGVKYSAITLYCRQ